MEAKLSKSGIYYILNTVTGCRYVGSAINVQRRFTTHRKQLTLRKHHSAKLQNAWNKYGSDAFEFVMIESVSDKANLICREQHWIDAHSAASRTGYNISPRAGSTLGTKRTAEAKAKMSKAWEGRIVSEETKQKLSLASKGKSRPPFSDAWRANMVKAKSFTSEETRAKMSVSHKGAVVSDATRAKLSAARKGKRPSEETRKKLSAWQMGGVFSDERRARISNARLGQKLTPEALESRRQRMAAKRTPVLFDLHLRGA